MLCSKCILIAIAAVGFLAMAEGNFVTSTFDEGVYKLIQGILIVKHPEETRLVKCLMDDFRKSKLAEKFYTPELLTNTAKLEEEIQPHLKFAEVKCKFGFFLQSPFGILILIAILLVVILICCCLIKCICC